MRQAHRAAVAVLTFCTAIAGTAGAATVVPYTFLPGTPAKAAEVNANFSALASAINSLASRVDKLEGTVTQADLAGNYNLLGYQNEFNSGANFGRVSTYTYSGTVTLRADGSGTMTGTERGHRYYLSLENGALKSVATPYANPPTSDTISWSYAGNTVSMLGAQFSVVGGGSVLLTTSSGDGNTSNILLLTRVK